MAENAGEGSGNPSGGGASGNAQAGVGAGTVDVNELVNLVVGKRIKKMLESEQFLGAIAGAVEKTLTTRLSAGTQQGTQTQQPVVQPAPNGNSAESDKLTLKSLQEQIERERKERASLEQKLKDEREKTIQQRMRSEVQAAFAKVVGADSPHLRPYVNEYMAQFVHQDGAFFRKTKDGYDGESYQPLDEAVEALFKGELKHLVPARNANLPPVRVNPTHGGPMPKPQIQQGANPLLAELAEGFAMGGRPELAQVVAEQIANGIPRK